MQENKNLEAIVLAGMCAAGHPNDRYSSQNMRGNFPVHTSCRLLHCTVGCHLMYAIASGKFDPMMNVFASPYAVHFLQPIQPELPFVHKW